MEMQSASRGDVSMAEIPGSYLPFARATKAIRRPVAYAVPCELGGVLAVLARQRFESACAGTFHSGMTESYRIESMLPANGDEWPALPVCAVRRERRELDDFVVFPTRQCGGRLLSLMLEPESQFGVHRFPGVGGGLEAGMVYPVLRVV
jgi:hypothetical protein